MLGMVIGLRDYTTAGIDLIRYNYTYESALNKPISEALNLRDGANAGFFLLNYYCSNLGISYQLFISIIGIICVFFTLLFYYQYRSSNILSVLAYMGMGVYTFQFSGLKQSIAMVLILWMIHFWLNGKKRIAFSFLFVAILFHPVVCICIPYLILSSLQLNKWYIILALLLLAVLFVFRVQIGNYITLIYDEGYVGRYESTGRIGGTFLLLLYILLLYYCTFSEIILHRGSLQREFFIILCLACGVQVLSSASYAFTRLNLCYVQFIPVILTQIYDGAGLKREVLTRNILRIGLLPILYILYEQFLGSLEGNDLLNYQMILRNI